LALSQTDTVIFTRPSFTPSAALLPSAALPLSDVMSLPKLQPAAPAATIANRKIAEAILLIFILFLPKNYMCDFLSL
jgi:hypothetical protein